jgi:hypothetical protein
VDEKSELGTAYVRRASMRGNSLEYTVQYCVPSQANSLEYGTVLSTLLASRSDHAGKMHSESAKPFHCNLLPYNRCDDGCDSSRNKTKRV